MFVIYFCFFFFFKQKTAYEMRISDWSSDVCSSDLLALEARGWKGRAGSALASHSETEAWFRAVLTGAADAGKLDMRALDLEGRPLAMLVNFLCPPGGFSFKTAFDEHYARFSPGVLLQQANLDLLEDPKVAWVDSCAAPRSEEHTS